MSWVLPQVFGYYGGSVAMRVSPGRRSRIYACQTFSVVRCSVRFLQPLHWWSLTGESLPLSQHVAVIPASSLQVCCDGCVIPPLEARVQPIQASPYTQDLRVQLSLTAFNGRGGQ